MTKNLDGSMHELKESDDLMELDHDDETISNLMRLKNKGKETLRVGMASDNLPWVEKYRPKGLDELISHNNIIETITRFIDENRLPHLLLYGPPGTGKTSTILACARKIYGSNFKSMILEVLLFLNSTSYTNTIFCQLNASDDRGLDVVRDQIKTFASSKTMFQDVGFKMIILDESDNMTQAAQNALRRVIEKYTKNVRFCLICNYVNKIIPAIQSRCTKFRFAPLKEDQIQIRLNTIILDEKVNVDNSGKEALLRLSKGDMRRALNILQSTCAAFDEVTALNVYKCVGCPLPEDIESIVNWLMESDYNSAYFSILKLKTIKGLALADIITEIFEQLTTIELPENVRCYIYDKLADI
ncbi:hypothetical protein HK099_007932, partial [Clydaea vesicula]